MAVTTTQTNKPLNPRGNDQSPKGYNRAELYSGKALDFDGVNDKVTTGNISIQSSNNWSIVLNVQLDNITSGSGYVFDGREGSQDGFGVYHSVGTKGRLNYYDNNANHLTDHVFPIDEYFHLAIIRDGSDVHFYQNGVFVESVESVATYSVTGDFFIGSRYSSSDYLNGKIGGFKAFGVSLTAAQVADLYNNPEKVVPTGVADSALKLWLPMQEGAGTTAYDGSGNGNHGTISGATYTHGIGAPVSQTAVIDWNKGQNLFTYSEDFSQTAWTKDSVTLTADDTTAPDGSDTAEKVEASASNAYIQQTKSGLDTSASYTLSVWAKTDSGTADFQIGNVDVSNYVTKTASTEWQRFEVTQTPSAATRYPRIFRTSTSDAVTIYLWGAQLEKVSSAGAYIPNHTATPITSEVLLPQGLTTGRDITGVNLFENVRKQGALNLDGNSWAEVHDNASVDLTDGLTLEAWVYYDGSGGTDVFIAKWGASGNRSYLTYRVNTKFYFAFTANGSTNIGNNASSANLVSGWNHVCVTYDGSDDVYYLNGSQDSTHSVTGSIYNSTQPIEIGRNESGANYINADIAQPRIYNRALTAEEVARNYTAGKYTYTND